MIATRLTPETFHAAAAGALNAVFATFDLAAEPFRESISDRLIVGSLDGFRVERPLYEAICRAADAEGDDRAFYSVIHAYRGGIEYHTWEMPLFDYEAYEMPYFEKLTNEDYDVGKALDGVMYSPHGRWGVLFPELFAIAGGSNRFGETLRRGHPTWRADLNSFLRRFQEAKKKRNVDVSWVQPLLVHLYGPEAPSFSEEAS